MAQTRRPIQQQRDATRSPAPEKVDEGARTRTADTDDVTAEVEDDERATRPRPRVRQIEGGTVHWFTGANHVREIR